ncbi:MAG TPA: nucleotidyltransferase family protein [Blastocatellia bacterium]|nr:nucleotidyltransferase family protein [Blastocatellia bacterium]
MQSVRGDSTVERGMLVAQLLAGSWRSEPPPTSTSPEELADIATLLLKSGSGGLAWNKIRHSALRDSHAAREFQKAYRLHSLQAALHERSLKKVLPLLRDCGVEPLLVKGWATARLYPELGLRPYSDLDFCVLPEDYAKAQAALKSSERLECDVDLHSGFGKFYDRRTEDIFARSRLIRLGDLDVRVLSAEDDLRFLCVHLLRHGAARPLWLCDIAVMLETLDDNFDWDVCLGGSRRQADWVACAIALARELLGAEMDRTPFAKSTRKVPKWMLSAVLEEWAVPYYMPAQFSYYLRRPLTNFRALLKEMPKHWPNPIEATVTVRGPFNGLPRLPFQVGHVFSRAASLVANLPKSFRPVKS